MAVVPRNKTHIPPSGNAGVITVAADADEIHVLRHVAYSYDSDPTGGTPGSLKVSIAGTDVFDADVTVAGPTELRFDDGLYGKKNEALVITLAALVGKTGRLNAIVD